MAKRPNKLPWWLRSWEEDLKPDYTYPYKRRIVLVHYRLTVIGFLYLLLRDARKSVRHWYDWPVIYIFALLNLGEYLLAGEDYRQEIKII
jgi:hypothetical protein